MKKNWSIILVVCLLLGIDVQAVSLDKGTETVQADTTLEEKTEKNVSDTADAKKEVKLENVIVKADVPLNIEKINKEFECSTDLASIAKAYYMRGIEIDGKTYGLYPEFEQPEAVMDEIKEKCSNAIDYLETQDNLPILTSENIEKWHGWSSYYTDNENELSEVVNEEMFLLDEFLNMYENTNLNDEICGIVEESGHNLKDVSLLEAADIVSGLQYTLPYNTGCKEALDVTTEKILDDVEKRYDVTQTELQNRYDEGEREIADKLDRKDIGADTIKEMAYSGNSKFNVARGVQYAAKYAENPNKKYTNWIKDNKDCTNFVSQIKTYGGVKPYYAYITAKYEKHLVKSKSWYYSSKNNYGAIWPSADKFAKFFGVKSTTTSFYTFSTKVKKGSFISYDKENDGKWNHMAFVTDKSGTVKKTEGVKYYNFRVAQHSDEYNAWVSADENHWETIKKKNPKARFAIVN